MICVSKGLSEIGGYGYLQCFAITLDIRSGGRNILVTWRAAGGMSREVGYAVAKNGVTGCHFSQSSLYGIWEISSLSTDCQTLDHQTFPPLLADSIKPEISQNPFVLSLQPAAFQTLTYRTTLNPLIPFMMDDDDLRMKKWGVRGELHYSNGRFSGELYIANPGLIGFTTVVLALTAAYKWWYRPAIEKLYDFSKKNYAEASSQVQQNSIGLFYPSENGALRRQFILEAEKLSFGSPERYLYRAIAYTLHTGVFAPIIKEWGEKKYSETVEKFEIEFQRLFNNFRQLIERLDQTAVLLLVDQRIIADLKDLLYGKGIDVDGKPLGAMELNPDSPVSYLMKMELELRLGHELEADIALNEVKIRASQNSGFAKQRYQTYYDEVVNPFGCCLIMMYQLENSEHHIVIFFPRIVSSDLLSKLKISSSSLFLLLDLSIASQKHIVYVLPTSCKRLLLHLIQ